MGQDPQRHHRRSIRLNGYNYSQAGVYLVTLCIQRRECLLGEVVETSVKLNKAGRAVDEAWQWLAHQYPHFDLDQWIVMPNHFHGILLISEEDPGNPGRGGSRTAPTAIAPIVRKPLGRLIGAFKTVSTKRINELQHTAGATLWQRNYYERIIRNSDELDRIRQYILDNPLRWLDDENHPDHLF